MSQPAPQIEPIEVPRGAYPIVRISSEFFLRSIDLLTQVQGDRLIAGLVFMAVWHNHMKDPRGAPVGVRELARRLNLPYETVRRHAMDLVRANQCVSTAAGIAVRPDVVNSRANVDVLRKMYLNTERMLIELTRAGLANYAPAAAPRLSSPRLSSSRLSSPRKADLLPDQMAIATASTGQLLGGIRLLGDLWDGDLLRGLVFTAIWTANVKHVVNTQPGASEAVLPDELRRPVSILAISNSLRLPYETVRRHAIALEKSGICHRIGRQGMVVPAASHLKLVGGAVQAHTIVNSLLADLRRAGISV